MIVSTFFFLHCIIIKKKEKSKSDGTICDP